MKREGKFKKRAIQDGLDREKGEESRVRDDEAGQKEGIGKERRGN